MSDQTAPPETPTGCGEEVTTKVTTRRSGDVPGATAFAALAAPRLPSSFADLANYRRSPDVAKAVAYIAGQAMGRRDVFEEVLREKVSNPERRARLARLIHNAATDEEALALVREGIRDEEAELVRLVAEGDREASALKRRADALGDLIQWAQSPLVLGPATESLFHRATPEAIFSAAEDEWVPPEIAEAQSQAPGVFLVQHDWAGLLTNADVDAGGVRLPFEYCCFEARVGARRVCALVCSDDSGPFRLIPIVQVVGGWAVFCSFDLRSGEPRPEVGSGFEPLAAMLYAQVRAVAIMLDAEVVNSEVVRAPHQKNTVRLKRGLPPIYDHHILTLARRPRALAVRGEPGGHRRRLHFRRGHWRHYAASKTWIRWCLVGDPSLGFADKDYRL